MKTRSYAYLALASAAMLPACSAVDAKTGTQAISSASTMQCQSDRSTMEEAVANYRLLERKAPRSEAALVPGYLLAPSRLMDLDSKGNVVAAPGSGCK
jgi:hypothetical protein